MLSNQVLITDFPTLINKRRVAISTTFRTVMSRNLDRVDVMTTTPIVNVHLGNIKLSERERSNIQFEFQFQRIWALMMTFWRRAWFSLSLWSAALWSTKSDDAVNISITLWLFASVFLFLFSQVECELTTEWKDKPSKSSWMRRGWPILMLMLIFNGGNEHDGVREKQKNVNRAKIVSISRPHCCSPLVNSYTLSICDDSITFIFFILAGRLSDIRSDVITWWRSPLEREREQSNGRSSSNGEQREKICGQIIKIFCHFAFVSYSSRS